MLFPLVDRLKQTVFKLRPFLLPLRSIAVFRVDTVTAHAYNAHQDIPVATNVMATHI